MNKSAQQKNESSQRGAAAVEFAIVAVIFFIILLGIIEFGRFMYLWNTVQEVTRIAAREAVVSDFSDPDEIDRIQHAAIFKAGVTSDASVPAGHEVTNLLVNIRYLNAERDVIDASDMPDNPADNIAACLDADRMEDECIRYVEASVCQPQRRGECTPVQYEPMVGLFSGISITTFPFSEANPFEVDLKIDIPYSTVIMPAESLGYVP